jgi:hypothetical protein
MHTSFSLYNLETMLREYYPNIKDFLVKNQEYYSSSIYNLLKGKIKRYKKWSLDITPPLCVEHYTTKERKYALSYADLAVQLAVAYPSLVNNLKRKGEYCGWKKIEISTQDIQMGIDYDEYQQEINTAATIQSIFARDIDSPKES